jgi:uncharacterized membrane protein YkvA (DUF1232 family)
MPDRNDDFYQELRKRIRTWLEGKGKTYQYADYLLFGPDLFHLLSRLVLDKRIPSVEKAKLAGAIAYFMSPIDLIPEAIVGPAGYIDDIALAAYVLNRLINTGYGDIAREHWAGDEDLLSVVQRILEVADNMIGAGLWKRLRRMVDGG